MEFADKPNFTVAGVTDWTAVGGHGSDATLRTSEALARKPHPQDGAQPGGTKPGKQLRAALPKRSANHSAILSAGIIGGIPPRTRNRRIRSPGPTAAISRKDHIQKLLAHQDDAGLHRLLGELDEKMGDPLAAVHEDEQAVRLDPSEQNYFAWGSELLLHRAVWQAAEVFRNGTKAHPKSARMLAALGTALFAGALYEEAADSLCAASDLNPADPEPYIFMGRIEMASPKPLACIEPRLARFVQQQPENSLANYFYAMAIWKRQQQP